MKHEDALRSALCPDCKGKGKTMALVDYADRRKSGSAQIDCMFCAGIGWVTERQAQWRVRGTEYRRIRVDAGISLHRAAKSYGINAAQLSAMEAGRTDPSPLASLKQRTPP